MYLLYFLKQSKTPKLLRVPEGQKNFQKYNFKEVFGNIT